MFAHRLAEYELEVLAIDMTVQRVLHTHVEGAAAMIAGSILKVRGSEMHQRLTELLVEVIGEYGPVHYADPNEDHALRDTATIGPEFAPGLVAELVYRRACTIYGGTAEIQRNIIAKAMFGL